MMVYRYTLHMYNYCFKVIVCVQVYFIITTMIYILGLNVFLYKGIAAIQEREGKKIILPINYNLYYIIQNRTIGKKPIN